MLTTYYNSNSQSGGPGGVTAPGRRGFVRFPVPHHATRKKKRGRHVPPPFPYGYVLPTYSSGSRNLVGSGTDAPTLRLNLSKASSTLRRVFSSRSI